MRWEDFCTLRDEIGWWRTRGVQGLGQGQLATPTRANSTIFIQQGIRIGGMMTRLCSELRKFLLPLLSRKLVAFSYIGLSQVCKPFLIAKQGLPLVNQHP